MIWRIPSLLRKVTTGECTLLLLLSSQLFALSSLLFSTLASVSQKRGKRKGRGEKTIKRLLNSTLDHLYGKGKEGGKEKGKVIQRRDERRERERGKIYTKREFVIFCCKYTLPFSSCIQWKISVKAFFSAQNARTCSKRWVQILGGGKCQTCTFATPEYFETNFFSLPFASSKKKRWEASLLPIPERITGCKFEKIFEFHVSVLTSTRGFF